MTNQELLRAACQKLRMSPMSLSDMIPLLQKSADEIESLANENVRLLTIIKRLESPIPDSV